MLKTHTFSYVYIGDDMIKSNITKRLLITTLFVFIVMFVYSFKLIPSNKTEDNVYYINKEVTSVIYVLDSDLYVSKTEVYVDEKNIEKKIKTLLESMTTGSQKSQLLKDIFIPVLPEGTKVIDVKVIDDVVKINFSKELLNVTKDIEEKMIEAIIYTISDNIDILGIEIYVDGYILKYLPNSLQELPTMLTKDFGINKIYNILNISDINKVIVWYIKENNDINYYVPVTRYVNDNRNKVEIIIDSLSSSYIYEDNLMSFLNSNVRLISYQMKDKGLELYFDELIFDDINSENILEEVVYTISHSMFSNFDINGIKIFVNEKEIENIEI